MRFVVDAQLPALLVNWLRSKGHDATHVLTALGEGTSDNAIVLHAADAVIVTKDGDFLSLLEGLETAPKLLWVRCGNTRNNALLNLFEKEWIRVESELSAGAQIVEVG